MAYAPVIDQSGWVAAHYLILEVGASLDDMPVARAAANPNPDISEAPVLSEPAAPDSRIARLLAAPVLPEPGPRVREIMQVGQARGMQANVFAKVGDCQTSNAAYLFAFDTGEYDLGAYQHLQPVVDFYAGSFGRQSIATFDGFTADALLDPLWADRQQCALDENALACEYRLIQPSVAIIMLGGVDKKFFPTPWFEERVREVVRYTIDQGIVPVLVTYPGSPSFMWEPLIDANAALLDIAEDEGIPLVNLWLASHVLPNFGLSTDNFHLSYKGELASDFDGDPAVVAFDGEEVVWGQTLHNLLTLQVLALVQAEEQAEPIATATPSPTPTPTPAPTKTLDPADVLRQDGG
jgi:hypothetical protein